MRLSDFNYQFPKGLIAQYPPSKRDDSRLLVLKRASQEVGHKRFCQIYEYLNQGDVLVLNDTRVIPARLLGRKIGSGGKVELLLLEKLDRGRWRALVKPMRSSKLGTKVSFDHGKIQAEIVGRGQYGESEVIFNFDDGFMAILEGIGQVPLPPYIKRSPLRADVENYQTVYARKDGAIACPTAGLHFTRGLLTKLSSNGVEIVYLTLHINYATFKPVTEEDISKHRMYSEYFELPDQTAEVINRAKIDGRRIVVVGTSSCRVLEDVGCENGRLSPKKGWTDLFIHPPYKFKVTDALLTNFHLPKTTLVMLVSAFCGRELLLDTYREAIERGYRLFSYGDAMLII